MESELSAPIIPTSPVRLSPRSHRIDGTPENVYRLLGRWLLKNSALIMFLIVGVYFVGSLVPNSEHSPFKHLQSSITRSSPIFGASSASHVNPRMSSNQPSIKSAPKTRAPPIIPPPKTPGFRMERVLTAEDFLPAKLWPSVDRKVIADIKHAASAIWNGTSAYSKVAPKLAKIAHANFDTPETLIQFFINWANVETGGNFNKNHINVSHQHDGTPETNYGLFQVNERWCIKVIDKCNPWKFTKDDLLNDIDATAIIAFNHLVQLTEMPSYQDDFFSALDIYWHGNTKITAYSAAVHRGTIIYYAE